MLKLHDVCVYIPTTSINVRDSLEHLGISAQQARVYEKIYGLERIPQALNMNVVELVKRPVAELIVKHKIVIEEIKFLVHTHTSRLVAPFGMSVVRQVKQELGLTHAQAFSVSLNNCASTLTAFEIAAYLLRDFSYTAKAIVVTGDKTFSSILQSIPNTSLTAEASAAALVSCHINNENILLALKSRICGRYSLGVWQGTDIGIDFEKNYDRILAGVIMEALTEAHLQLSDIKLLLPHNVNLISWQKTAKRLALPLNKIYLANVRKLGHCFGADILINYWSAKQEGLLRHGDYFVMATVGLGAVFSAAVFKH